MEPTGAELCAKDASIWRTSLRETEHCLYYLCQEYV